MSESSITIEDAGSMIEARVMLPRTGPAAALSAFTDPRTLTRWWVGELQTDLSVGGEYIVHFPAISETMSGQVVRYQPGDSLEFTWHWLNQDDNAKRSVAITVSLSPDDKPGSVLTIIHGPFDGAEEARAAREGWKHFLPRLTAVFES